MPNALILSSSPGWAAQNGLANSLLRLGLSVREAPWPLAASFSGAGYQMVFIQLDGRTAAPDPALLEHAGLSNATVLICGSVPSGLPSAYRHLADCQDEIALATALADAGFMLPLPTESEIESQIGQLVDGDAAIMAELIASLLDTNQTDLRDLRQACESRCWSTACVSAHRIKGTAHLVGAASLAALSQSMEAYAKKDHADAVLALAALYLPAVARLSQTLAALVAKQA